MTKLADCKFFIAGTCKRNADACTFRHSEVAKLKNKPCHKWAEKQCSNENCKYLHLFEDAKNKTEVPAESNTKGSAHDKQKLLDCTYFLAGSCTRSRDACTFRHSDAARAKNKPCRKFPERQCFNENCEYLHIRPKASVKEERKDGEQDRPKTQSAASGKPRSGSFEEPRQALVDCKYFLAGHCPNANCTFRHSESARAKKKPCQPFLEKRCTNTDCPRLHIRPPPPPSGGVEDGGSSARAATNAPSAKAPKDKSAKAKRHVDTTADGPSPSPSPLATPTKDGLPTKEKEKHKKDKALPSPATAATAAAAEPSQSQPPAPKWREIVYFWDMENCAIPRGLDSYEAANVIRKKLNRHGVAELFFKCYCDVTSFQQDMLANLHRANVELLHVPRATKQGASDSKMMADLSRFIADKGPAPIQVVLITGDIDFITMLGDMKHRLLYDVVLLHNQQASEKLRQAATRAIEWTSLLSSVLKKKGTTQASLQVGVNGSNAAADSNKQPKAKNDEKSRKAPAEMKKKKHENESTGGKEKKPNKDGQHRDTRMDTPSKQNKAKDNAAKLKSNVSSDLIQPLDLLSLEPIPSPAASHDLLGLHSIEQPDLLSFDHSISYPTITATSAHQEVLSLNFVSSPPAKALAAAPDLLSFDTFTKSQPTSSASTSSLSSSSLLRTPLQEGRMDVVSLDIQPLTPASAAAPTPVPTPSSAADLHVGHTANRFQDEVEYHQSPASQHQQQQQQQQTQTTQRPIPSLPKSMKVAFRTHNGRYWQEPDEDGCVSASNGFLYPEVIFMLHWESLYTVSIETMNHEYLALKPAKTTSGFLGFGGTDYPEHIGKQKYKDENTLFKIVKTAEPDVVMLMATNGKYVVADEKFMYELLFASSTQQGPWERITIVHVE